MIPTLILLAGLIAAPVDDPREAYDVLAYDLDLTVDPVTESLSGSVEVTLRALEELDSVRLDLVSLFEVSAVERGDVALEFEHEGARLDCALGTVLQPGDETSVRVTYSGKPRAKDSFTGFHWARTEDGRPWINTSCQGPGAHSWWPCKSSFFHPDDKPERVSMSITVPEDLYAVSNGRLDGIEVGDGTRTFHWKHGYPLETYTVTLNVAPYVVVESELELPGIEEPVPYAYYVLPESEEKAAVQFAQVPELLEIFSEAFGPWPFPDSKFGLVETNFWGMEHSTAVAYGSSFPAWCEENGAQDRYASRNRYFDYILVHEVAHEWWGNAVSTTNWGDFWIHEGFGTYAEGVYVEMTQGLDVADQYFREQGRRIGRTSRLYRGEDKNSSEAYAGVVYSKGACVLHTLRHYVDDDEAWWQSMREFNLRFRYGNAGTDDFRAVLEEITGREWKGFFDSWVYGEGYPKVEGRVSVRDGAIEIDVENEGSGGTEFRVPLDLAWTEGGEARTTRLWLEPGETEQVISCAATPTDVRVVNLERVLGRHEVEVR